MASKLYKQFKADTYSGESTIYKQFQEDLRYGSNTGNADVDLYIALRRKQEADREVKQQKRVSRINQERQNRVVQNATLNQQRAATTDFLRTERENLAKTPERTFGTAFKMQMDLGAQNQRKTNAEKRQKDYREKHGQDVDGSYIRYGQIQNQPDYAQNVEAGKQAKNIFNSQPESILDYLDKDVRVNERVRANDSYGYMNETEKNLYRYLVGKYGAESGAKYVESIRAELNQRAADKKTGDLTEYARENPSAALGDYVHSTLTGYANAPVALAKQLYNNVVKDGESLDPNDPSFQSEYEKAAIREGLKNGDGLKNIIPNAGIRNFVVDTGLSIGENLLRLPMGRMSLVAAGIGAGASGMRDALERGATGKEAMGSGIASGAAEAFFEKFSLENLKQLKTVPPKTFKDFLINIGKQSAVEGSEEVFTEIANTVSDSFIMGELSQYNLDYQQFIANGEDEKTARQKAFTNILGRIGQAFAGGAVSGGIMGGGAQALGIIEQEIQYRDIGRQVNPDYWDYSEGIDTDIESYEDSEDHAKAVQLQQLAQEYADRQRQGEFISNRDKGRFEIEVDAFVSKLNNRQNDQQSKEVIENQDQNITGVTEPESLEQPKVRENQQRETFDHPSYEPVISEPEQVEMSQNQPFDIKAQESLSEPQKRQETANLSPELVENGESQGHLGEQFGRNGKNAFVDNFSDDMDLPAYTRAFGRAYDAGRYDVPMDVAEHSAIMSVLGSEQMENAFKAGAQDRQLYSRVQGHQLTGFKQGDAKTGNLTLETGDAAESHIKVAERVGKLTGLNVVLVNNQNRDQITAAYGKGRIMLDVSEENFMGSVSHELTHFIQDYSPDLYDLYRSTAVEALMKSRKESLDQMIEAYGNSYAGAGQNLSRDQIMDEIVADATQSFLNDETFIRDAVKQDKGIGERIIDFLTDVIDAIKELIHQGSDRKAARALEENIDYLERARKYWMSALEDAGDRYRSGMELENQDATDKYSLAKPDQVTEEKLEENYDFVRNMEPVATLLGDEFEGQRGVKVLTEAVTQYYNSLGNQVHNDVVGDILLSRRSVKDDIAHGYNDVKAITFKAVPEVLEKGKILQFNKDWKARGYDTAVIGGKINVAKGKYAGDYYQVCVVKVDVNQNRMYLHEVQVIKTDGNIPFKTWTVNGNGLPSGYAPPIYSIFDKLMGVNEKSEKHGIRYQLRDVDDSYIANDVETLIQENKELKEANELLKKQFELTSKEEMRQEDILKISKKILHDYGSDMKSELLAQNLTRLYEYIRSSDGIDSQELSEAAAAIARSVLNNVSKKDTVLYDQYKDLRKQIHDIKIMITEQDKHDLAVMGGYNTFRKKYFGKMKLGNDGISVDSLYQELSEQHPELFDPEITHPAEQLMQIGSVLDTTQPVVSNPYHANMDEMSYIVGQELLYEYNNVRNIAPTFADRKQAELMRVKKEYQEKTKAYKNKLMRQYREAVERSKNESAYNARWRDAEVAHQREKFEKRVKKQSAKRNIIKDTNQLTNWLLKPTDSKHIPQELRATVAEFLSSIDLSSNYDTPEVITKRTQAWNRAKDAFRNIIDNEGMFTDADGNVIYTNVDPDLAKRIEEIAKKTDGIEKLDDLGVDELEELQKTVVAMKKALMEANQLKSNRKSGEVSVIAEGVLETASKRKNRAEYGTLIGTLDQLLNYDILDANTMFSIMGEDMHSLHQAVRGGQDTKTRKLKAASDYVSEIMQQNQITGKDIREWQDEKNVKEFETARGEKLRMSVAQIMSLYELNKRKQARGHIYSDVGGIKPGERIGKFGRIEKAYKQVRVTAADVEKILKTLTPKQIAVADALQQFMGKECSDWGNEVTMEMYGYKKFTARDYFPIKTDDKFIGTRDQDLKGPANESTIKNMGITKSTVEHANNPLIVDDIFSVFKSQVDKMSAYNAYVIPLSDLQKVYNYKDARNNYNGTTIKQEIDRAYGKKANRYIHQYLVDVNGTSNTDKAFSEGMIGNMKAAAVSGNIRVAIQQPTAYVRALDVIDAKYLLRGVASFSRKGQWEEICKYAPVAQWKDWGFVRSEVGPQLESVLFDNGTKKEHIVEKTNILSQKADQITWIRLWNAVEYETMDLHPELEPGSEEFKEHVGQRFSKIIDDTQVADSVIARTQISRSSNKLNQMATSFMSEPLKTYNMLYRAAWAVKNNEPGAKRKATRTAAVFVLNGLATALAASVIDAVRDKDKSKKWKDRYWGYVKENAADNLNIFAMIPYIKDVISIYQGYTVARSDMSWAQNLKYAYTWMDKLAKGESQYTPSYVLAYTLRMSSSMTGLPVNNIVRDLESLVDEIAATDPEAGYKNAKTKYVLNSNDNLAMYVDMIIEAKMAGDKELQDKIIRELNEVGVTNDDIAKKIYSQVKKELVTSKSVHPDIDQAATAKLEMDFDTYESAVARLQSQGYSQKLILSAVKIRENQITKTEDTDVREFGELEVDKIFDDVFDADKGEEGGEISESLYGNTDLVRAIEKFNNTPASLRAFERMVNSIVDKKVASGKTKKKAIGELKSSITQQYKEMWMNGNSKEREQIQNKLKYLKVDNQALYSSEDWRKWLEDAKEKK